MKSKLERRKGERKMAIDIPRAWKDAEYRKSLTPEELASLPPNPAGSPELGDADLNKFSGGQLGGGVPVAENSLLWCPPPTEPQTNCCEVSKDICCKSR
jgi:mersacidin/lichenicidin family type 2 lantibiotic